MIWTPKVVEETCVRTIQTQSLRPPSLRDDPGISGRCGSTSSVSFGDQVAVGVLNFHSCGCDF